MKKTHTSPKSSVRNQLRNAPTQKTGSASLRNAPKQAAEDAPVVPPLGCHWIKVIVTYRHVYQLAVGLPLLTRLVQSQLVTCGYFARYTAPPFRLELQLWTNAINAQLFKTIMDYKFQNTSPKGIRFEECEGSMAHAQAFNAVMYLHLADKLSGQSAMSYIQDLTHWIYNMAGFSYIQETGAAALTAYYACRGVPGWTEEPVFGLKPGVQNTRK